MVRIVSITPGAVDRESRTFKQAASFDRLGYDSIVVEGLPSKEREGLPFKLVTVEMPSSAVAETATSINSDRMWRRAGRAVLQVAPQAGSELARDVADGFLFFREFARQYWTGTARVIPPASLYYLHSYFQFPAVYAKSRRFGAPFVYDAHDFYPVVLRDDVPPARVINPPLRRLERLCASSAHAFVSVSDGIADVYAASHGRRPVVVRNCHDVRLDEVSDGDVRAATGAPDGTFLVVVVGHAKPGQPFEQLIDAIEGCPGHVQVACVGAHYDDYASTVRNRGLQDRIHFLPPVPARELSAFIRTGDAAAILYTATDTDFLNALPNRFFYPVAAGLPILYPSLPEISRLAEQFELGVQIDPRDSASIASGIRSLSTDSRRVTELRTRVERAQAALSWEHEEQVLDRVVTEVLSTRGRSSSVPDSV